MQPRRGFTLIELIAVVVVLAILSAVALPRFFDHGDAARDAADDGALGGIRTALQMAHMQHRMDDAPASAWVTDLADVAPVMQTGALPEGMSISGNRLIDQRGNRYQLIPETATEPARLEQTGGGGWS